MRTGNSPSYLVRNPYSYCFRIIVPKDLQAAVFKKELRYSLKTGNLSEAKTKARFIAGQFQLFFRKIRHMSLTKEQIDKLIREYKERLFEKYDRPVMFGQYDDKMPPEMQMSREGEMQWTSHYREWLLDIMGSGNYTQEGITDWKGNDNSVEQVADKALTEQGINPDEIQKQSEGYSSLCKRIIQTEIEGINSYQGHLSGEFSDEFEQKMNDYIHLRSTTDSNQISQDITLGQLIDEYVAVKKKKWVPGAAEGFNSTRKLIEQFLGSKIPIHTLTRATIREFRDTLVCLPLRFTQSKYRNMSASEVRALDQPSTKRISGSRANDHLAYLTAIFHWAIKEKDYITANPAMGMTVEEEKKSYDPFSRSDIETIFSCDAFNKAKYPYKFWLPILGLYTGARREELCNLYEDDIKQDEGVWYIDIRQNRPDKRIKGKAGSPSERKVPLHPFVKELGFIEYVKTCKGGRLWPELKNNNQSQKYGVYFGKRFNDIILKKTGIKPTKEQQQQGAGNKTYHSFRHTVITHLINLDLNIIKIKGVVGHEKGYGMTTGRYYHGQPIKKIYDEVISKIDYGIDLSHLKNSKYVVK